MTSRDFILFFGAVAVLLLSIALTVVVTDATKMPVTNTAGGYR